MKQKVVEKEWKKLRKAEKAFLDKNREVRIMGWQKKGAPNSQNSCWIRRKRNY